MTVWNQPDFDDPGGLAFLVLFYCEFTHYYFSI